MGCICSLCACCFNYLRLFYLGFDLLFLRTLVLDEFVFDFGGWVYVLVDMFVAFWGLFLSFYFVLSVVSSLCYCGARCCFALGTVRICLNFFVIVLSLIILCCLVACVCFVDACLIVWFYIALLGLLVMVCFFVV